MVNLNIFQSSKVIKYTKEIINDFDAFLFDCDGVIWKGKNIIPGTPNAINKLIDLGKTVIFVTNNSTKTRLQFVDKLKSFGINANVDNVIGSSYATALYLQMNNMTGDSYIIGENGLFEELSSVGIKCSGNEDNIPIDDYLDLRLDDNIKNVVVGMDIHFNYRKLSKAMVYITNKNCKFIATNSDATFPLAPGIFIPGAGSIVESVSCGAGKKPDIVIGKPSKYMMDIILKKYNLNPSKSLMIGDRLETDISFGNDVFLFYLEWIKNIINIIWSNNKRINGI